MKMKTAPAFAALLLASACATYEEIRTMEPIESRTVAGDYRALAECFADRERVAVGGGMHIVHSVQPADRTARVSAAPLSMLGSPTASYSYDVAFAQQAPDAVSVQLRSLHTIWGTPIAGEEWFDRVSGCATALRHQAVSPAQR